MNTIKQLYDEKFVMQYFKKKLLPLYPEFSKIKKIKINGIKNHIWENTYHVVVEYDTFFITADEKIKKLNVYCSAHTNEQRRNVYDALKFLWSKGFNKGNLTIPHPLFYSQRFKGIFYRGCKGNNLYHYIQHEKVEEAKRITVLSAKWFAKLHKLKTDGARNFNKKNSLMETTIPGAKHWLNSINERHPEFHDTVKNMFDIMNQAEKTFLRSTKKRWLIHGDAHPENIIKMSANKIGAIDFTDMCLADFTRDIGGFLQQLEYMAKRHFKNKSDVIEIKKLFLQEYLKAAKLELTDELEQRIKNYYNWAALRTVIFFLIKEYPEPDRAQELLEMLKKNLNIKNES